MSTKLSRIDHRTFSCRRFRSGSDDENQPVRSMSVWYTRAVIAPGAMSPGQPVTSAYRKPWIVKRGSHSSGPRRHEHVGRLGSPQRPGVQLAVLQHLGVPEGDDRSRLGIHRQT